MSSDSTISQMPTPDDSEPGSDDTGFETSANDSIDALTEEFVERLRLGESPTIEEYADRYPELAAEIRDVFPMLGLMERAGQPSESGSAPTLPTNVLDDPELGDYVVLREIGRGGMGVVFEAEHKLLRRRVALKVLPTSLVSSLKYKTRFYREARAAARLHHSNIVPVFDFGEDNGVPYYAMQYINGLGIDEIIVAKRDESEASKLPAQLREIANHVSEFESSSSSTLSGSHRSNRWTASPWRNIAKIGRQAADALHYAHQQGVLHRDIKPSNLIIDSEYNVWITDFGLAKTADDHDLTATGDFVGTLRYLAPEAIEGESERRSDVYGLGLVLFELIAQRSAFAARDRGALIRQIVSDGRPALDRIASHIPRDLCTIIHKATDRIPNARYSSAAALRDDLQRFINDEPIKARPITRLHLFWRWAKRNQTSAWLLAAVLTLFAVGFLGTIAFSLRLNGLVSELGREKSNVSKQRDSALERLFHSHLSEGAARRTSGQLGQRFQALNSIRMAAQLARDVEVSEAELFRLRTEAIGCLGLADVEVLAERWIEPPFDAQNFDFSPDGTLVAFCNDQDYRTLKVARIADQQIIHELDGGDGIPIRGIKFSADGRWIAYFARLPGQGHGRELRVHDTVSGKSVFKQKLSSYHFDISRDRLAGHQGDEIFVWDLPSGEVLQKVRARVRKKKMALSADGSRLAALGDYSGDLIIWDVSTGLPIFRNEYSIPVIDIALSPDGTQLASTAGNDIKIWNVDRGTCRLTLEGHTSFLLKLMFSADGTTLLSSAWGNESLLWSTQDGVALLKISGSCGNHNALAPEGRVVIHRGKSLDVCRVVSGNERRTVMLPKERTRYFDPKSNAVHPDGRLLALASPFGLRLADALTTEEFELLPLGLTPATYGKSHIDFDHRGKYMLTSGWRGIFIWPIRKEAYDDEAHRLVIGPPERFSQTDPRVQNISAQAKFDPTGRYVVGSFGRHKREIHIVDLDQIEPNRRITLPNGTYGVSASNNAELVAVGSMHSSSVFVYRRDGQQVAKLPTINRANVSLSPDGKFAAVTQNQIGQLYSTDSWKVVYQTKDFIVGEQVSFSPDSKLAIFTLKSPAGTLLVDSTSAKPLTVFPSAADSRPSGFPARWTPKTDRLVTFGDFDELVSWDMAAIRRQLRHLDLDWSTTEIAAPVEGPTRKLYVEFDWGGERRQFVQQAFKMSYASGGELFLSSVDRILKDNPDDIDWLVERGKFWLTQGYRLHKARRDFENALALDGKDIEALRGMAELHLAQRDYPQQALFLERILALDPDNEYAVAELAWNYAMRQDSPQRFERARLLAERAVESKEQEIQNHLVLSAARYKTGELEDALRSLNRVHELGEIPLADVPAKLPFIPLTNTKYTFEYGPPVDNYRSMLRQAQLVCASYLRASILHGQGKDDEAAEALRAAKLDTAELRRLIGKPGDALRACILDCQEWAAVEPFSVSPSEQDAVKRYEPFALAEIASTIDGRVLFGNLENLDEDGVAQELKWIAAGVGHELQFETAVKEGGKYTIHFEYVGSPDSADFQVLVDGIPAGKYLRPYVPSGEKMETVEIGPAQLDEGKHEIVIRVMDRESSSFGYHLRLKSLEIRPVSESVPE